MTVREALATLSQRVASFAPSLPEEPLLANQARQLEAIFSHAAAPLADRLNTLREILKAASEAKDWSTLARRDWIQAAWVLWVGRPRAADLPGFVEAYVTRLEEDTSAAALRRLIYVYFRDFCGDLPGLESAAEIIRRRLKDVGTSSRLTRWKSAQDRFAVFDPMEGPDRAAQAVINASDPLEVERKIGLTGELSGPNGLAGAVHIRVLLRLRDGLETSVIQTARLRRLLESFEIIGGLRFEGKRTELADALLLPWIQIAPANDVQQCIFEFLISHLKDPRLHPSRWHGASDAAIAIIRRWLAKQTLEEFFQIVDQSAKDSHWIYRRAFWLAYFRRGVLDDAWMALGPQAARAADNRFACGKLRSGDGVQPSHSLLLMEIGDLVIAEWSHDGKCRAWKRTHPRAPLLGRAQYTRGNIIIPSMQIAPTYSEDGIVHRGSEAGRWQQRLADFIYQETNVRVMRREYMPNVR
jgi:hypothetical protein